MKNNRFIIFAGLVLVIAAVYFFAVNTDQVEDEKGKMKVFDDMHNKLNDADVERLRFIAQTTDQMASLIHR